MILPMKLIQH